MGIQYTPEPIYFPIGGINNDSNGITCKAIECIDAVNVDITSSAVLPRRGTLSIESDIFLRDSNGEIILDTVEYPQTITVVGAGYPAANGDYTYVGIVDVGRTWLKNNDDKTSIYQDVENGGWYMTQPSSHTSVDVYGNDSVSDLPPRTGWYKTFHGSNPAPTLEYIDSSPITINNIPQEQIIHYHRYLSPISGLTIFAFCATKIYRYVTGAGWENVSGTLLTGKIITQWSTISFIDNTLGTTVVAAGSQYIRPSDLMSAGGERALLYWDETTSLFKVLVQKSSFPVVEEECLTGVSTNTALGRLGVTVFGSTNYDSSFLSVVPGLTNLYTNSIGQVASIGSVVYQLAKGKVSLGDASDGALVDCYKLLPVDDTQVVYGDSSYVRVDGKEVSIQFKDATFDGDKVLIDYNYYRSVSHSPMHLISFQNALVSANTFEEASYYPYRVRWTEQGSIFETRENYYQDLVDVDISQILALKTHETAFYNTVATFLFVYRNGAIHRGRYNSNYSLTSNAVPFFLFEIALTDGIESSRTAVAIGKAQIFMSRSDIYLFDGIERKSLTLDEGTGNTRIRDMIFSELDLDNLDKTFAVWDEFNKKYMLFVKKLTDVAYPSTCYLFNTLLNQWTRYIYPEVSAAIATDFFMNSAIADMVGTIGGLTGQIDALGGRTQKTVLLAMDKYSFIHSSVGAYDKVTNDSIGIVPDYYIITKDFFGNTLQNQDRIELVYLEAQNGEIEVSYNGDYERDPALFAEPDTLTFTSKISRHQYNMDVTGNSIRFLLRFFNGNRFRWMQVFTVQQEQTND